ncbi:MATE family efflux transporter [Maridesulfovibrio hydrothermalis]|uniref:Multidrug-efflux transporter n=1 Tax=Maridesulfovibrio hydrothermalis AM13 = DSM 14728 TaxID=1121451 RepID=L0RA44_9BACT|nr:MATE family efflux transporter [Maridesulfovibrio hydrothermalis]CCO22421.1 MATE efflux family protein [Maridesulfovibrio hydrothermalis AM13 = DSM 14728]
MIALWDKPFGYKHVLKVSMPLAISMASTTIMQVTDRIFLGRYSVEAIAAALPAGILSFLFISFFMGVASYINVFIAQYTGAAKPEKVAASLWQGIYFSLGAWVLLAAMAYTLTPLLVSGGHPPEVLELEIQYFRILMLGAGLPVLDTALSGFYSGRGLTRTVMVVNMIGAAVNIPLDYALINGVWFFPEMGIRGAGIATVTATAVIVLIYCPLIFSRRNEELYKIRSKFHFDFVLFKRFIKYGLSNGIQFFLDIFAITFFVYMVGRLGTIVLAASNIALSIDGISFFPAYGIAVGVSTLVGQAIGQGRPDYAKRATKCALHITCVWMLFMGLVYLTIPDILISMFRPGDLTDAQFGDVLEHGRVFLMFMIVYILFDGVALVYSGALKGAGDVVFVMKSVGLFCLTVMVIPCYIGVEVIEAGPYFLWGIFAVYVLVLSFAFYFRFKSGKWEKMKVIE